MLVQGQVSTGTPFSSGMACYLRLGQSSPGKATNMAKTQTDYKLSRRSRLAVHIYARLPSFLCRALGLRGERALRFLGLDSRDFVHYQVAGDSGGNVWEAIWEERKPFKTHALFCAAVLSGGECDCGAVWCVFDAAGQVAEYIGECR